MNKNQKELRKLIPINNHPYCMKCLLRMTLEYLKKKTLLKSLKFKSLLLLPHFELVSGV